MLPFTREQFLAVFVVHNHALWPLQLAAAVLGIVVIRTLLRRRLDRAQHALVAAGLAAMWFATGLGYHALQFSAINPAAWVFAALFLVQAALLLVDGVLQARLRFEPRAAPLRRLGWALVIYAAALYPALGLALGLQWTALPAFGLTPCPVALFTTGCLLLTSQAVPRRLLAVPLLWSLIGGSAALLLGMPQDGLLAASSVALLLLWRRRDAAAPRAQTHASSCAGDASADAERDACKGR
jgi:Family of unknown function (DUF6064)